jgi:hypothetical protein
MPQRSGFEKKIDEFFERRKMNADLLGKNDFPFVKKTDRICRKEN